MLLPIFVFPPEEIIFVNCDFRCPGSGAISSVRTLQEAYHQSMGSEARERIQECGNRGSRKASAFFCLLAVLLLQAPFARAAWMSSSMACCMGDQCKIPSHHHKGQTQQTQKNDMPMDCDRDMNKMSDCKMSCCKTTDETAIDIAQFVVPDLQIALGPLTAISDAVHFVPQMISRSEKPQPPPPKSAQS